MIYDGYDCCDLFRVEDIDRQIVSDIDFDDDGFTGIDGSTSTGIRREAKLITVFIRLVRPFPHLSINEGFEKARRLLGTVLYRRRPCKLTLHDAPDIYDMAMMTDRSSLDKAVYTRTAELTFTCPSPSSWSEELYHRESKGGKVECLVDGNDDTAPVLLIDAEGPFTVLFDDEPFNVDEDVTGQVIIDARNRRDQATGHHVYKDELTVSYTTDSFFPEWEPGIHTIECERPFSVEWRARWL